MAKISTARHASVFKLVQEEKPNLPVHILRPHVFQAAAKWFLKYFPGKVVYAVKTNPEPTVLNYLYAAGVRHFDVASLHEIQLIAKQFPDAHMHYMHPVKNREAIRKAYFDYGIRDFSLDSHEELAKILQETGYADDLRLFVRIAISNGHAAHALSGKFGVPVLEAPDLLRACQEVAQKTAICFHVGSQCMSPEAYTNAITLVAKLLRTHKLSIDVLDIGGGFPSIYPDLVPPSMISYMKDIGRAYRKILRINPACELWSEPGRALVAEGGSLLVKVELRKGDRLYINDGTYGTLFDAGHMGMMYPTRMFTEDATRVPAPELEGFTLYGPTCDSLDVMKGPFMLPSNIDEGDYIEIGQLGAYGASLQSNFNGFHSDKKAVVLDAPMLSLYGLAEDESEMEEALAK